MSLNYNLREGMTNADLDDHKISDETLFFFLMSMELTGVPTLNPADKHTYLERLSEYLMVSYSRQEAADKYRNHAKLADILEGMGTNVSRYTKTQWKNRLIEIVRSHAADMRVRDDA